MRASVIDPHPPVRGLIAETSHAVREALELSVPERFQGLFIEVDNGSMLACVSLDKNM